MIEILAHSGDPTQLTTFLVPSGYPGETYLRIFERLALIYFVPLCVAWLLTLLVRWFRRGKPELSLSMPLIALAPASVWLVLVYADATYKGSANILELVVLGLLAGLILGLGGKLVRPLRNGVTSAWVLAVLALTMFLYVPPAPSRVPSIAQITALYAQSVATEQSAARSAGTLVEEWLRKSVRLT